MEVLIVGMGIVGKNVQKRLAPINPNIYDIDRDKLPSDWDSIIAFKEYDFIYICVDTPTKNNFECDTFAVESSIGFWKSNLSENGVFVVKSTIPIGTTDELKNKLKVPIVFSPEFYGNTLNCNNYEFDFTILGGERSDCIKVQHLLQKVYDARHTFWLVSSKEAEVTKYMENSFLAFKVCFCSQFHKICKDNGIDYEVVRELVTQDPRISKAHTFIDPKQPYFDSHCLNKDVSFIAHSQNAKLLLSMLEFNEEMKRSVNQPANP